MATLDSLGLDADADAELGSPFERAAYRQRETVMPYGGRQGDGIALAALMAQGAGGIGAATRFAVPVVNAGGRVLGFAPRAQAATAGASLAMSPLDALGEERAQEDPRVGQIERIEAEIAKHTAALVKQSNRSYPSRAARENAARPLQETISSLRGQVERLNTEMSTERTERDRVARAAEEAELARQGRVREQRDEEERIQRAAERPLVEKNPALWSSLPVLGGLLAGGFAYAPRIGNVLRHNKYVDRMMGAVERAESATMKAPKSKATERAVRQVEEAEAGYPAMEAATRGGSVGDKVAAGAAGGMAAGELSMLPYQIDYAMQGPDTAAGQAARERLGTAEGWLRTGASALVGATGATIGSAAPSVVARRMPDMPRARAAVSEYRDRPQSPLRVQPQQRSGESLGDILTLPSRDPRRLMQPEL